MLLTLFGQNLGTLYPAAVLLSVIYPSALGSSITAAQIAAGNGPDGAVATWSGSAASPLVSTTTSFAGPTTQLSIGTRYRFAVVWWDGSRYSNVAVSAEFTTSASVSVASSGRSGNFNGTAFPRPRVSLSVVGRAGIFAGQVSGVIQTPPFNGFVIVVRDTPVKLSIMPYTVLEV